MPEELLRGGGSESGPSGRHWLVLPLSIAAHALAGLAIVIIPVAATVELPAPHRVAAEYVRVISARPLEIPPPRGGSAGPARPVPVTAPSFISESDEPPTPEGRGEGSDEPLPGIPSGTVGSIGTLGSLVTGAPPAVPPPPPVQRRPLPVGGEISVPRKIVHVAPVYPRLALYAGVEGTVMLEAVINEQGKIERLKVLRSVALLDAAAIDAVTRWRYTPTTLNNVPVPVLMTITVTFSLRD